MKKLAKFERVDTQFNDFLHLIYYIYGGCKFNCQYCFTINNKKRDVNLDDQYKIIDTFFRLSTPFDIYFYGGEPTEYEHLHDVIDYVLKKPRSSFRHMEIQTNLNVSREELERFCSYDHLILSPSLHINFLRGDTIYDLIDKLDILYNAGKLERIDFMLEKWKPEEHYKLNDMLKAKEYYDKVMYTFNYMEINKHDKYTGSYNTIDMYSDIIKDSKYQEKYRLTYDDDSSEEVDISELYLRDISFKGWDCDAGKYLMYVEYSGDWWLCDTKNIKEPPMGNILTSPARFLMQTKVPFKCDVSKCDGCYYINKVKR
jgi:organic radical activating enzyme